MSKIGTTATLLALALLWTGGPAHAEEAMGEQAILAVIDKAFNAIGSGDGDALRALQLPKGTSISFRPKPDAHNGELMMRMTTNEEMVARMGETQVRYLERWTGTPSVRVRGPIATVWGEYEFLIDGEFSHCGVDAVDLVYLQGRWTIANWLWTVEREGCPTAPGQD